MSYAGFYINLDRCPDRRAEMEEELARCNLAQRYKRFAAADGNTLNVQNSPLNKGEIGCFTSHYLILKENLGRGEHLHVVEDDTLFAPSTEQILGQIIDSGEAGNYDMFYTDLAVPLSNDAYRIYKSLYDSLVVRGPGGGIQNISFKSLVLEKLSFNGTSSFLINKNSVQKLYELYHEELMAGLRVPIDVFLRENIRAGVIKAACIFPFITSARVERTITSTVRRNDDPTRRFTAGNLARYSFFIGCDWGKCMEMLERYVPPFPPPEDRHAYLLARILAFSGLDAPPADAAPAEGAAKKTA